MKKLYSFDDHPEHQAKLAEWRDRWLANAMSTKPMDEVDREAMRVAVRGMYEAAGLKPPPDHRIVFVASPLVMRFAGGFAAWIWHRRGKAAIYEATHDATRDAINDATRDAINDATREATNAATRDATHDATREAIYEATHDATRDATSAAINTATDAATRDATHIATDDATSAAINTATDAATHDAINAATSAATDEAISDATREATDAAIGTATREAADAAINDAINAATSSAIIAATRASTEDATREATSDATDNAINTITSAAINTITSAAINDATDEAINDATSAATRNATTRVATENATSDAMSKWYSFEGDMRAVASKFGEADAMLRCAEEAYGMVNGGNQWSGWVAYLSFFRHIAKLDIDYSKFDHYEKAAIHGGPRLMHKEFCIISDRPKTLKVDERNRSHCDDGPFCEWSDGFKLYSIHGVRVPRWVVEFPEAITVGKIDAEPNAEIRRVMIDRFGPGRYIHESGAKLLDMDALTIEGSAPRALMADKHGQKWLVGTDGSTARVYHMPVPQEAVTCRQAHDMIAGFEETRLIAEA